MHISMTSTLRRTMTPSSPSANSAAEVAMQHLHVIHDACRPTSSTASAATTAATSSTETSSKCNQYSFRNSTEKGWRPKSAPPAAPAGPGSACHKPCASDREEQERSGDSGHAAAARSDA